MRWGWSNDHCQADRFFIATTRHHLIVAARWRLMKKWQLSLLLKC